MWASAHGHLDIARLLLEARAVVDRASNAGEAGMAGSGRRTIYPKGPNTSLEGVLGWFLGVKPLLRRYLDP